MGAAGPSPFLRSPPLTASNISPGSFGHSLTEEPGVFWLPGANRLTANKNTNKERIKLWRLLDGQQMPSSRPPFGVRRQAKRDSAFARGARGWPKAKAPSPLRSAGKNELQVETCPCRQALQKAPRSLSRGPICERSFRRRVKDRFTNFVTSPRLGCRNR